MVLGEVAGLVAAMSYSIQSHLVSSIVTKSSPMLVCLIRNTISMILSFLVMLIFSQNVFPDADLKLYGYLIISGISGVTLADALYLYTLYYLGARKAILLETLAPPFTGLISYFYLDSTLSLIGWIGVSLTIYGIYIVVNAEYSQKKGQNKLDLPILQQNQQYLEDQVKNEMELNNFQQIQSNNNCQQIKEQSINSKLYMGLSFGIAANFCQALGMVLSHDAMISGYFDSINSTFIRLAAGILCIVIIVKIKGQNIIWPIKSQQDNRIFFISILIGPIIGIWSQQFSLIYTRPEVVQTLLATTPVFGLFISKYKGEEMKLEYYIGSFIAVLGVAIIIWF
ncbi:integral membrane protein DUF6 containing protein (macronuclear) [Tetrahymena thermophila SB210]|uniref:Integral membrane protein DUF6 containing protein n=1 Tax=Tetrahymena thermophila (strain SB210) TaxID=312017 RepID=X1W3P0_TETTS|nr:integral membrane protein DUF6 containing protein [Tetrahymena thermophila SB210]EAR85205.2 integral membrane protein DUF6 containing protein [Tetrahymena thermophila SB210]|eukprot:XP_001032868.2 integral membrane protein DUF6 containing protein [Tetrahymena thermophila SB210]